jgi:hypothetical protein
MTMSDQRDGSTRVEREVLEILERAEASQTPVDTMQAAMRRRNAATRAKVSQLGARPRLPVAINSGLARIVGALVLALLSAVIADYSRLLAVLLAIGSLIVFFSLWFPTGPSGSFDAPRWRGQDLRDRGSPPFGIGRNWRNRPRR